jgi:Amt family ammonium transporter
MALDEEVIAAINNLWVLVAAIFCFFLQAGFGLLEVGSVRAKNAQNIMLKNLVDAAVAAIAYWAFGYAFAYGSGGNPFIGNSAYFLKGDDEYIGWFFQMVFAGTTGTFLVRCLRSSTWCIFQVFF